MNFSVHVHGPAIIFLVGLISCFIGYLTNVLLRSFDDTNSPLGPKTFLLVLLLPSVSIIVDTPLIAQLLLSVALGLLVGIKFSIKTTRTRKSAAWGWWFWLGLLGVALMGTALRFYALDAHPVASDARFHFSAAVGYLKTGEFLRWDFLSQSARDIYERAWFFTWNIALVLDPTNPDPEYARMVSAFWGSTLLLPAFLAVRQLRLPKLFGLAVIGWVAISPHLISISRWIRMYAPFDTAALLVVVFLVGYFLQYDNHWLGLLSGGLIVLAAHLHLSIISFLPPVVLVLVLLGIETENLSVPVLKTTVILGTITLLILFYETQFSRSLFYFGPGGSSQSQVGFFRGRNLVYLSYLLDNTVGAVYGSLFVFASLWSFGEPKRRAYWLFGVLPFLGVLFFNGRPPQYRYISFLFPLLFIVLALGATNLYDRLENRSITPLATLVFSVILLAFPLKRALPDVRDLYSGNLGKVSVQLATVPDYERVTEQISNHKKGKTCLVAKRIPNFYRAQVNGPNVKFHHKWGSKLTVKRLKRYEETCDRTIVLVVNFFMKKEVSREALSYLQEKYRLIGSEPEKFRLFLTGNPK